MTRQGRWPLHPQPLPNEALSSWLVRLGRAYRLDVQTFLARALGVTCLPPGTLDRDPPPGLVEILSRRTGVPVDCIRSMTLAGCTSLLVDTLRPRQGLYGSYVGELGCLSAIQPRPAALARGLDERTWLPWVTADLLQHEHPRCCRRCLVEDTIPHVRLAWRAAWVGSCAAHGERLETAYANHDDPGWSYGWKPAEAVPPALTFVDRLTWAGVTTGVVELPHGRRVQASVWLRLLRALADEVAQPVRLLGSVASRQVARAWRDAGFRQRVVHGVHPIYEKLPPERRDAVLAVAGLIVQRAAAGELAPSARQREIPAGLAILRPEPITNRAIGERSG